MSLDLNIFSEIEKKRKLRDGLARIAKLKKSFGLQYYEPHYKQDRFHLAGEFKRRYMRTGNRFGKSDMGAAESCAWALGYRPWYEREFAVIDGQGDTIRIHKGHKDHPYCFLGLPQRPTKGLIICEDWEKATEIFTSEEDGIGRGKLFKYLPDLRKNDDGHSPGIIKISRNSTGITILFVRSIHGGVSSMHLDTVRSYKSNQMGQESSNWDWIQVDEPCPQGMWKAVARGLVDTHGSAWFNCTPLRERWINDMFIPGARTKLNLNKENVFQIKGADRWVMVGSMHDNPWLSTDAKQEFISELTDGEIATRIDGKPAHYQGLIYSAFDYDRHVFYKAPHGWKDMFTPPSNYCVRMSIDPHPKTPHAVLFCATAPTGEVFFFSEIFNHCLVGELLEEIRLITGNRQLPSAPCDWVAFEENPVDGSCMADEFDLQEVLIHKAPRSLSTGIIKTQAALAKRNFIFVSSHLSRFLYEIDSYAWDPLKEKPVDSQDHMMENFYRLVLEGLDYIPPINIRYGNSAPIKLRSDSDIFHSDLSLPTQRHELEPAAYRPGGIYRDV